MKNVAFVQLWNRFLQEFLWADALYADTVVIPQVLIYASNSTSGRKSFATQCSIIHE